MVHDAAVLFLSRGDVQRLLDLDRLIDAVAEAMGDLSTGRASMPPRAAAVVVERDAFLGVMPAYLPGGAGVLASKLVAVFPHNGVEGLPSHQAVIVVFDPATGTPEALMDGEYVTAMRTAAGAALATRLLARDGASTLAILGTGVQARSHGLVVPRVWSFAAARVAGRDPAKAERLAGELSAETGVAFTAAGSYAEAVAGADVVCATTHSPDPVVRREWLAAGALVTSVGVNPAGREIDADTVRDALVVVESRESTLAPAPVGANDVAWPVRDGELDPADVIEIGELVTGSRPGRTSPEQLVLYKSAGVAVQDAAAAALVLTEAHREGVGTELAL
jgi:alanine dehydrogenase